MKMLLIFLMIAGAMIALGFVYRNANPKNTGVQNGALYPCPSTPNCVSSLAEREDQKVMPMRVSGKKPISSLAKIILSFPRARIAEQSDTYLRAEFQSLIFRFIDDVEFLYLPEEQIVHIRSAARTGYSDFGVNRKRIEKIRVLYEKNAKRLSSN